jgi:ArsR family transcriptional regulator
VGAQPADAGSLRPAVALGLQVQLADPLGGQRLGDVQVRHDDLLGINRRLSMCSTLGNIDTCRYVSGYGKFFSGGAVDTDCCAPLDEAVPSAQDADRLAAQFAALADPVRLRLLSLLATSAEGAVCACDLVEPVGRSQPTVSHHLKVLTGAGLVTGTRQGRNIWYAAEPTALDVLRVALGGETRRSE